VEGGGSMVQGQSAAGCRVRIISEQCVVHKSHSIYAVNTIRDVRIRIVLKVFKKA
jgi:hypothetical protein